MFILRTPADKQRAIDFIKKLPLDEPMYVRIETWKKYKSSSQRNIFHKFVRHLAKFTGDTEDEKKDEIILTCYPPVVKTYPNMRFTDENGKVHYENITIIQPRKTESMTKEEYSVIINKVMEQIKMAGITVPIPDDYYGGER